MDRKDEITEASHNCENYPCGIIAMDVHDPMIFQIGAEWADKHMKKGLVDIDKACEWLRKNADDYTWYDEFEGESGMIDEFVSDFCDAMIGNIND